MLFAPEIRLKISYNFFVPSLRNFWGVFFIRLHDGINGCV